MGYIDTEYLHSRCKELTTQIINLRKPDDIDYVLLCSICSVISNLCIARDASSDKAFDQAISLLKSVYLHTKEMKEEIDLKEMEENLNEMLKTVQDLNN